MAAGTPGDDRWWRDFDGFVLGFLDGPSRILDVGSGDGSLGRRLREAGHDVVGVDPNALDELAIRARIEEVEPATLGRFDLVCASMALHHIDLPAALDAVAAVLEPEGLLVVNEFDWPAYDARAVAWVDEPESSDPVEHWATEHADLHSRTTMLAAIGSRFTLREEQPRPYLARMVRRPEREPDERAAIAAGRVPALGFWLVAAQPSAAAAGGAGPG
jgi:SAM-dependent methyltransferase